MDPYTHEDPSDLKINNKLSMLDELTKYSDNYTYILSEYSKIQKNIENTLNNVLRSINNSPKDETELKKFRIEDKSIV